MLKKWMIAVPAAGLAVCLAGCDVDVDDKPNGDSNVTIEDKTPNLDVDVDTNRLPDADVDTDHDVDVDLNTDQREEPRPNSDPGDNKIEGSIDIEEN